MSKRYTAASYPLVLALLFGLAISLIPASSVLGDNITACQGSGSPSSSLKLGGRTITPTLILQAATGGACPTGETSLGLVSLSRTLLVSPVVTATTNGTALLAAMTLISNSNPSASNPWLLKLEPGNYDLGSSSLTLLPYVDLEGSGEDTTIISSTIGSTSSPPNAGTLVAASNSEVRLLTVANSGTTNNRAAVRVPSGSTNTRFSHLTATVFSGGNPSNNYGLSSQGTSVSINNSTFSANGTGNNANNFGLANTGTMITSSSYFNVSGTGTNSGLSNSGTLTLSNSTLTASGSNSGYGIKNDGGTLTVTNVSASATGTAVIYGLYTANSATATVANSTLAASGGVQGYGLYSQNNAKTTVTNSTLSGTGSSGGDGFVTAIGGTAQVSNSQLTGSTAASSGLTLCPYSVNGATFAPLDASCL